MLNLLRQVSNLRCELVELGDEVLSNASSIDYGIASSVFVCSFVYLLRGEFVVFKSKIKRSVTALHGIQAVIRK
jgi:hypothetical protein